MNIYDPLPKSHQESFGTYILFQTTSPSSPLSNFINAISPPTTTRTLNEVIAKPLLLLPLRAPPVANQSNETQDHPPTPISVLFQHSPLTTALELTFDSIRVRAYDQKFTPISTFKVEIRTSQKDDPSPLVEAQNDDTSPLEEYRTAQNDDPSPLVENRAAETEDHSPENEDVMEHSSNSPRSSVGETPPRNPPEKRRGRLPTVLCFASLQSRCNAKFCSFAHSSDELVTDFVSKYFKTHMCLNEKKGKECPFKLRCHYVHHNDRFVQDGSSLICKTLHPTLGTWVIYKKCIIKEQNE